MPTRGEQFPEPGPCHVPPGVMDLGGGAGCTGLIAPDLLPPSKPLPDNSESCPPCAGGGGVLEPPGGGGGGGCWPRRPPGGVPGVPAVRTNRKRRGTGWEGVVGFQHSSEKTVFCNTVDAPTRITYIARCADVLRAAQMQDQRSSTLKLSPELCAPGACCGGGGGGGGTSPSPCGDPR
jgi:hypothetical protein